MLAALVLAGLVLSAGLSGRFRWSGVAVLVGMSLLWLMVNGPVEGVVLLTVAPGRGITGADLAAFVGLALAAAQAVRLRREPSVPG